MKRKSRTFELPTEICERWFGLRKALNVAAFPFTGKDEMAVSIFEIHNVIGAEKYLDKMLDNMRKVKKDIPLHGSFSLNNGKPICEVSWWE